MINKQVLLRKEKFSNGSKAENFQAKISPIGKMTIFALFFRRDDVAFQHTWEGAGGATSSYPGFTAMANEVAESRIYGGIHFRFDQEAGQSIGRNIAHYVFLNFMRPRQCVR